MDARLWSMLGTRRVRDAIQPTRQFVLNIVAPIRGEARAPLDIVLDRIAAETLQAMHGHRPNDALVDFGAVPNIHYARWVLIPGRGDHYQSPGGGSAPHGPDALALNAWYDGPEGQWAADEGHERQSLVGTLVAVARRAIDALYEHCLDYPRGATDAGVVGYLCARHRPAAALYFGAPGRSRRQIVYEADLARRVRLVIDSLRTEGPLPDASAVRTRVLAELGEAPAPFPPQHRAWASLVGRGLALVPLLPALPLALLWLRVLETHDRAFDPVYSKSEREHVEITTHGENLFFENPLSNVVEVKDGWFRRQLLKVVLFSVGTLGKDYFVRGRLGKIPSIHAAHWYLLDDGRRLAFVSNYDSSWESYLGDFIDQASSGLTAIWSNTSGYPRTRFLAFAGASAGDRFKAWSHHIQVRTRVWYSAYPSLSIVEINDATLIRRGLADERAVPPDQWLARVT